MWVWAQWISVCESCMCLHVKDVSYIIIRCHCLLAQLGHIKREGSCIGKLREWSCGFSKRHYFFTEYLNVGWRSFSMWDQYQETVFKGGVDWTNSKRIYYSLCLCFLRTICFHTIYGYILIPLSIKIVYHRTVLLNEFCVLGIPRVLGGISMRIGFWNVTLLVGWSHASPHFVLFWAKATVQECLALVYLTCRALLRRK